MANPFPFIPGLELSRLLYEEGVCPLLLRHFPDLVYGAGRLDSGSDVLGFDTPRSMDHDWGPRLTLFLPESPRTAALVAAIQHTLGQELPSTIHGIPTHFARHDDGTGVLTATDRRPINHAVTVTTLRSFCHSWLGINLNPAGEPVPTLDEWLTIPEQQLRTFTGGAVFRDNTGELEQARAALRWYPHDVWLFLLAAGWRRIEQEEAFVGRCGEVADDLGCRLVTARLVHELMHLCFLMERQYAPYSKWFGSAFAQLASAPLLTPPLHGALAAATWREREQHLSTAYELLGRQHNALAITAPLDPHVSPFHSRPYQVIHGDRFWQALRAVVTDPALQRLMADPHAIIGSTPQWADSTDVRTRRWDTSLRSLYRAALEGPEPA